MINEGYQETFDKVKQGMLGNVSKLIKKYKNPDAIIYGKARKEAKKVQDMENTDKLKEAVKAALMNEKKKPFPDLTGEGKVTRADILKARGVELKETNLYPGEEWSIEPEGRFWIVTYRTMDGTKEKVFQSEDEAKEFTKTLNEDLDLGVELDEYETRSVGPMLKSNEFKIGDKVKYKGMNYEITRIIDDRIYIKNLKYGFRPETWVKAIDLKKSVKEDLSQYKVGDKIKWSSPEGEKEDEITGIDRIYLKLKSGGSIPYQSVVSEDLDLGHEDNEPHMLKADEREILDQVRNKLLSLFQPYGDFLILDMTRPGQTTGENFRLRAKSKGADWKRLENFIRNNPDFTIKHISKQTFDNPKTIDFSYKAPMMEDEITGIDGIYLKLKSGGSIPYQSVVSEDLDLGHEDDEPHMLKADLYKIGKYAMELYQMVDQFEGQGEVDFPAWWQSKITNAASMISSAKHYLEFELKEPEIDAMVGVAQDTGALDEIKAKVLEKLTAKSSMKTYIDDFSKSKAPQFKGKSKDKRRQMAIAAKLSK